jgi:hypothetical protein
VIGDRLSRAQGGMEPCSPGEPEFSGPRPTYEMAERLRAIPYGDLGAMHQLVRKVGLPAHLDAKLRILLRARPY